MAIAMVIRQKASFGVAGWNVDMKIALW